MSKPKGKARAKASKRKRLKSQNDYFLRKKRLLAKIRKWQDPMLSRVCETVEPGEDISEIVKDLKQVLAVTDNGVGLAAPQVGYAKRVFAMRSKGKGGGITILINTKIVEESTERVQRREGCLSYPNYYTVVERPNEVTMQYETEDRKQTQKKFKDMEACIALHEHDHTYGVCLVGDAYYHQDEEVGDPDAKPEPQLPQLDDEAIKAAVMEDIKKKADADNEKILDKAESKSE